MPGKLLEYIVDFPRVVGGIGEESTRRAVAFYKTIVRKEITGTGVGGHCLPKDSWLLQHGVRTYGSNPPEMRLIPLARQINDGMPGHVASSVEAELRKKGRQLGRARVAILGVAYLENSDDARNSPAAPLARLLLARGAEVVAHDPHVRESDWQQELGEEYRVPLHRDLNAALAGADCVAVITSHDEYRTLTLARLRAVMRTIVVIRGRNDTFDVEGEGVSVQSLGKG